MALRSAARPCSEAFCFRASADHGTEFRQVWQSTSGKCGSLWGCPKRLRSHARAPVRDCALPFRRDPRTVQDGHPMGPGIERECHDLVRSLRPDGVNACAEPPQFQALDLRTDLVRKCDQVGAHPAPRHPTRQDRDSMAPSEATTLIMTTPSPGRLRSTL